SGSVDVGVAGFPPRRAGRSQGLQREHGKGPGWKPTVRNGRAGQRGGGGARGAGSYFAGVRGFGAGDCVGGRADGREGGVWRSASRAGDAECAAVAGDAALFGNYCAGPEAGRDGGRAEFGGAIGLAGTGGAAVGELGGASGKRGSTGGKIEESGRGGGRSDAGFAEATGRAAARMED